MKIPALFIIFIYVVIWFNIMLRKKSSKRHVSTESYLEVERAANFTSKKEIPDDLFIVHDINLLPIKSYDKVDELAGLIKTQQEVIERNAKKMIRPNDNMSNKDIKLKFGFANFDLIMEYEGNFVKYIFSLCSFAESLSFVGLVDDAIKVLKETVRLCPDQSKPYLLLIDMYFNEGNKASLIEFKKKFDSEYSLNIDNTLKIKIEKYFNIFMESMGIIL